MTKPQRDCGRERAKWTQGMIYHLCFCVCVCVACQVPPSMGFSRQEYWSRLPFPSPGVTCVLKCYLFG